MELKIIKKSTKYNYSGEMIISKAEHLAAEIEFWRNVGKQIEIPGFRKGQAPESLVRHRLTLKLLEVCFVVFFNHITIMKFLNLFANTLKV
jgi:FKBP-type peptidyl-prolyl cis-trans isomerase (trigger factor)